MGKQSSQSLADQLKPYVTPFRFDGTVEFHLKSHKTAEKGGLDKEKGEKIIEANRRRLVDFQEKLYAQDNWSMLLIFQGMDAAGKDSAIKSVFDGINPQGCEVTAFKVPSSKELDHDFLWRTARCMNMPTFPSLSASGGTWLFTRRPAMSKRSLPRHCDAIRSSSSSTALVTTRQRGSRMAKRTGFSTT